MAAALLALATSACDARLPEALAGSFGDTDHFKAKARAIDGDTVSIDFRLFGADAVERRAMCERDGSCWPCGKAAQDYASRFLKRGTATIHLTGDQSYGRPVASVSVDGQDMGEAMISAGFAVPATSFLKNDPERARAYEAAYEKAGAKHLGVHAGTFIEPSRWRKDERLACERKGQRR
ncbi:thermonuclease family protein [Sphingomonas xinjiangensis]|uniref:Endonuclease YncB(Thermonuclease family) n=1 Tax=Sphingomonas xinjiangensis TaxID=643568 RepID=A0A840YRS8_9SPHN|nr:endonuclease YncB(thermonuclease family) [Sphingomonas xinjiangensis]